VSWIDILSATLPCSFPTHQGNARRRYQRACLIVDDMIYRKHHGREHPSASCRGRAASGQWWLPPRCAKRLICRRYSAARPPAPRAFYLAIARSAVCASPVPHNSSLSCDLTRTRRSAQAAVSVQTHCSRYVDSLAGRTCVMFAKWTEARTQELHRLCPLFADRTQEDGK
jgi:hypothetical protein